MIRVIKAIKYSIMILASLSASVIIGCSSPAQLADLEIHGAWDVIRLAEAAAAELGHEPDKDITISGSSTSIDDLKQGLCNVALLGREPTEEELIGLRDYVIAYDAVCIIIDEKSYVGGLGAVGQTHKTDGLKELTLDELSSIGSFLLVRADLRWQWQGEYYVWGPLRNASTGADEKDPITGITIEGWTLTPKTLRFAFNLIPGKYDTQRSLYDSLGICEQDISDRLSRSSFTVPELEYEEEIVAFTYEHRREDFMFTLGFASRRVAILALEHAPVQVVAINGINPVQDTQAIYDGTYPLSRKIHLLTNADPSQRVNEFVDYMLSPEGQDLVEKAGYLPLLQEEYTR